MRVTPSTATDPRQLASELRERINPAYAHVLGTESYERRICAEAIERLLFDRANLDAMAKDNAELRAALYDEHNGITATLRNGQIEAQVARIADLEAALDQLRDRVIDEYDRIYISGVLGK